MSIIIIPDIHGRTFWKEAVNGKEHEKIIFLGDYLDPYPNENISKEDALLNFKEIIEFKKTHIDNVILLLGNHDFAPYINNYMTACRTDNLHKSEISNIFLSNLELFNVAHIEEINGVTYTFSHAPFTHEWKQHNYPDCTIKELPNILNNMLFEDFDKLCNTLNVVSWYRGGYDFESSPIWSDVRELSKTPQFKDVYMIFGHTQLISEIITDYWACLDCRRAFELKDKNFIAITKK